MAVVAGIVLGAIACASRSSLPSPARDLDVGTDAGDAVDAVDATADAPDETPADVFDTRPETFDREVSAPDGAICGELPPTCTGGDDFARQAKVATLFEACTAEVGAACGDMTLVFDDGGCLVALTGIALYAPAFVDCVTRRATTERWVCAQGRTARMFQGCP
jgi:hypothetical protein